MSWDASIMKFPECADLASADPIVMGTLGEVRELLERDLGKVIWNSPRRGHFSDDQCSMEVSLSKIEADVFSIGFKVQGGGDPIGMLVDLCKSQSNWCLIDEQNNSLPIDLDNPSRETWEEWSGVRTEIAGDVGADGVPTSGLSVPANLAISVVLFAVLGFGLKKLFG